MSELLRAEGVRVEFDRMVAVRDVDLTLHGGQLVGLVGPNGAGKTTLLRALAGLQPITAGQIDVMGSRLDGRGKLTNPSVGFAPDTPPVYEDLTVSEFLGFIARQYDIDSDVRDERIEYWIERLWLTEKRKQKIKTLSRGMRQRVTIARAFLPNPYVIFLDEPAAGLDPAGRVHFRELLVSLVRQQKVIIVSSHILSDMEDYCTHLAIMGHGRILRYGPVREIAEHDAARCRYTVMLSEVPAETERILAELPGLSDLRVADHKLEFEFDSDPAQASNLLRGLVERGLRVCSFSPVAPDLEDAYLRVGMKQVE
jgi:ABC-2 type transport system ATP-binding protein